jgi:uncharacterized protein (TIGR02001 family)
MPFPVGQLNDVESAPLRFVQTLCLSGIVFALSVATPAQAQLAAHVSLDSNAMFRGESISSDDPAASIEASLDHESGFFAGASISFAAGQDDPRVVASTQYVGYSTRQDQTSFEVGIVHRNYGSSNIADTAYRGDYFEGFVGVRRKNINLRLYVSPDYLVDGRNTYYGDANVHIAKVGKWSLAGHGGLSVIPQDIGEPGGMRFYYDWRLSISRPLGKFSASAGIAGTNYPIFEVSKGAGFFSNSPKVFLSISRAF